MGYIRKIIPELSKWKVSKNRKPLVLRGARQVGKTTIVRKFAEEFTQYIELNLENEEHSLFFKNSSSLTDQLKTVFLSKNKSWNKRSETLLFIDEIQSLPKLVNQLRFFYENLPEIPIITAGSMLETLFDHQMNFPVGRVEYLVLRPVNFYEYLGAIKETEVLELLNHRPIPSYAEPRLFNLFKNFSLIGGMPEVVKRYAEEKDLKELSKTYNSLITSYLDDVEKYARNTVQTQLLRYVIRNMFAYAGRRITFEGFGNSRYKSREMSETLRTLEKALILNLIYPCTQTKLPMIPDLKKSPKLQVLDFGLMNYFVGLQAEIMGSQMLENVYDGILIENLVGQEILSEQFESLNTLNFWARDKKGSTAEVDFIINYNSKLIPIEVKSGKIGKLKSLLMYMDETPHNMAVRIYQGGLIIEKHITTNGKEFYLLNLPYFLSFDLLGYLEWFENSIN